MKKQIGKFTIDTSITFVTGILQLAFGIGISIIIARILGPQGKGIYSLAILFPFFLISFGNFGIAQASVFYIAKKTYLPKEVLGNNIILSFLLGIFSFFIGLIIILFFSDYLFPEIAKIYLFLALFLIPLLFFLSFINYLLLGMQRIKEYNFINIFQSFISLVLLLIFLLTLKLGVKEVIIANILSFFVTMIVSFYLAKRIIGVFHLRFNRSYIKDAFGYGFKIYLGDIIQFLHHRIDIFLVNIFLNPIAVGLYSISVTLVEKIWLISQSAGVILFPKVSSETNKKNLKEFTPLVCRNVLLVTLIGTILLFFIGRLLIVLFYSKEFLNSVLPFQILLIGAVTMSGWRILANDLYGRGRPELNIYINFISVVLNIILNILWIPKFGIAGVAWATSVSYTFAFILILFTYSKISKNSIRNIIFIKASDFQIYYNVLSIVRRKMGWVKLK